MSNAFERQIRPAYDALDHGAPKSALQHCNKLLKKKEYADNDLVKALKALSYVRLQKLDESLPICDEILQRKPMDVDILNILMLVLRGMNRLKDMQTMYEDAFRAQPMNEELGSQAFLANVRIGNWKSAQNVAQRLQKNFKQSPHSYPDRYLYWSAFGAILQAEDQTTPENMRSVLFKLALRLLEGIELSYYVSPDRLWLQLHALYSLEMYDEAAKLLDTEEGKAVAKTSLHVDEVRRNIVQKRKDFVAEGEVAKQRLLEGDRNWLEYQAYLDAIFVEPSVEKVSEAREFLQALADKDGVKERGSLLGLLELEHRARAKDLGSVFESDNGLLGLIKAFIDRFADKPVFYEDLLTYITFEGEEIAKLKELLASNYPPIDTLANLRKAINIAKLQRYILTDDELTPELEQERALLYLKSYSEGATLGTALPDSEIQPADDFAILCAQTLINLWKMDGNKKSLEMAVSVLEHAIQRSKNNYFIRLHIVRIYFLLCAPSLAIKHYRTLRVKETQNDSISHFILSRGSIFSPAAAGDATFANEAIEAGALYIGNAHETNEYVVRAFLSEKYTVVHTLIETEQRIDCSINRDLLKIESVRMKIASDGLMPDVVDLELIELKFVFDRMHVDNRDLNVLKNYQPRGKPSFNDQTTIINVPGFSWLKAFLRIYIRVFLLSSDIDETVEEKLLIGDRPKLQESADLNTPIRERIKNWDEEELAELSEDERSLFTYITQLCEWLTPYHDFSRPPPEVVVAEAQKIQEQQRAGKLSATPAFTRDRDGTPVPPPLPAYATSYKREGEPPAVQDAPEAVVRYFEERFQRFKNVAGEKGASWETLQVAVLTQEAALLLGILCVRFKNAFIVKQYKFGALLTSLKSLVSSVQTTLKEISSEMNRLASEAGSAEARKQFVEACKPLADVSEQIGKDTIPEVSKMYSESRKKVFEGVAKGLTKVATSASHLGQIVDEKKH